MWNKLVLFSAIAIGFAPAGHAQWAHVGQGLPANQMVTALCVVDTTVFAGTADSGVYRFNEPSNTWEEINTGLTGGIAAHQILTLAANGSNLYVGTGFGLFLSNDRGDHWSNISSNMGTVTVSALVADGSTLYAGTRSGQTSGVFVSSNNGIIWNRPVNGLPVHPAVSALVISGTNLLAGVEKGIYQSTDGGFNWWLTNGGQAVSNVEGIVRIQTGLIADIDGHLSISTDDGADWSRIPTARTGDLTGNLASSQSLLFAGTIDRGVFLSRDAGTSWETANSGLADAYIMALATGGGYVYTGTYYGNGANAADQGVWRWPLSDFANAAVARSTPATLELSPNPTWGSITVHDAPLEAHVSVLNMLGQSVLESTEHGADFTLDLSRLAPGTYCVRLTSPSASMTRMIVKE